MLCHASSFLSIRRAVSWFTQSSHALCWRFLWTTCKVATQSTWSLKKAIFKFFLILIKKLQTFNYISLEFCLFKGTPWFLLKYICISVLWKFYLKSYKTPYMYYQLLGVAHMITKWMILTVYLQYKITIFGSSAWLKKMTNWTNTLMLLFHSTISLWNSSHYNKNDQAL